jgi:hypothetical protein
LPYADPAVYAVVFGGHDDVEDQRDGGEVGEDPGEARQPAAVDDADDDIGLGQHLGRVLGLMKERPLRASMWNAADRLIVGLSGSARPGGVCLDQPS